MVMELQYKLYQELDYDSESVMLGRHLIPNTNYTTRWRMKFTATKMVYHQNSFGKLAKCSEIPTELL